MKFKIYSSSALSFGILAIALASFSHLPQARADIGVLVFESLPGMSELVGQAGHNAIYLSNICPDGSPTKMRFCEVGEEGSVLSRNNNIQGLDWTITPMSIYLSGVSQPNQAPLVATPKLKTSLEDYSLDHFISTGDHFKRGPNGERPSGDWTYTAGMGFLRDVYNIHMKTTAEQDLKLLNAFNDKTTVFGKNESHFSLVAQNCANFVHDVIDFIMPDGEQIQKGLHSMGMTTPKGNAMAFRRLAKKFPDLHIWLEKYTQTPGTYARSADNLFITEIFEKNIFFTPLTIVFIPKLVLASFLWNDIGTDFFSVDRFYRNIPSQESGDLTASLEEDEAQKKLTSDDQKRIQLASDIQRIKNEQKADRLKTLGDAGSWKQLRARFQDRLDAALKSDSLAPFAKQILSEPPTKLQRVADIFDKNWKLHQLSQRIIQYLETNGVYTTTDDGASISLSVPGESAPRVSGLAASQLQNGDQSTAFLIWTASMAEHLAVRAHNEQAFDQTQTEMKNYE